MTILIVTTFSATAQVENRVRPPGKPLPVVRDTVKTVPAADTVIAPIDTLKAKTEVTPSQPRGDIETTINYSARDSIITSVDGQKVWLYGDGKIDYGEIELEADMIEIDYLHHTLTAHGRRDSLGRRIGFPVFKNGPELYETRDIVYNFKTGRARISEVVTEQGEGYLHGDAVYKNERNELLSYRNTYTTCNLEHPHFRIRATRTKAIPNDKIISGPFYMEFNDVPTPLGFAFGMFPAQRESKSGIIFPSYGEERVRGFNLRGGGYFFDISEYIKVALTGDLYSKGGHAIYANSNYNKRYHYTGGFNFSYSKFVTATNIENPTSTNDYRLTWNHSPQSKGTGRFSASVSAATATFNQNNNLNFGYTHDPNSTGFDNTTRRLNSNVSYNKTFPGTPFSMGVNFNHTQDLISRQIDLLLPSFNVNMNNVYPFQRKNATGPPNALSNVTVRWTMNGSNRVTNNLGRLSPTATTDSIAPFEAANFARFFENGRRGIRHEIPISTSLKVMKHFTLAPSINYSELWYGEQLVWGVNDLEQIVIVDTLNQFNRVASYGGGLSLNTRIYGMYLVKNPASRVKAIRHVMNPQISMNYRPDFSNNPNYFQQFVDNNNRVVYRSRHEGFLFGGAALGESQTLGFGLNNQVEMKVKSPTDSIARKVMLLNNLSFNSGYNFLADSFKLANINIAANTNILQDRVNVNITGVLDPYVYQGNRRVDQFAWSRGSWGRITNAVLALSTNLNPKGRSKDQSSREKIGASDMPDADKQFLLNNPQAYVDFEIPWSLRISYNVSYSNPGGVSAQVRNLTQAVRMSGDLSLSEKWKITYNTGYDFQAGEITQTDLGISRDLHCWVMNFNWVPFGRFTSYNFRIAVKASILQDLKMERRKPFFDNL